MLVQWVIYRLSRHLTSYNSRLLPEAHANNKILTQSASSYLFFFSTFPLLEANNALFLIFPSIHHSLLNICICQSSSLLLWVTFHWFLLPDLLLVACNNDILCFSRTTVCPYRPLTTEQNRRRTYLALSATLFQPGLGCLVAGIKSRWDDAPFHWRSFWEH